MAPKLKRSSAREVTDRGDLSVALLAGPLELARRRQMASAVFLVDLDNFHVLNNGLGRSLGDEILNVVSHRLEQVGNSGQSLACGGDRFIVLVSQAVGTPQIDVIADSLVEIVRMPIPLGGDRAPVVVSASIGCVVDDGVAVDELVRRADIALARAKTSRVGSHTSFEPAMANAAEAEALLENELREALETELLFLAYLPGIDIATGRVTSAEALLRWNHPRRGVVTAQEFMPLLEQSGTIVEVGSWVLHDACMQAAAWQRRGMSLELHVNVSARQLGADRLLEDLRETLSLSRLDPGLLVLEVAEATVIGDPVAVTERLKDFKDLGVSVAMDSFGAAYAALSQLKHLPLDILEFDRSLVADVSKDDSAKALVRTLVQIAKGLGLQTLAIGVENEEQLGELRKAGCGGALGHLYSEPVIADEFDKIFQDFDPLETAVWSQAPETVLDNNEAEDEDEAVDEE